MSVSAQVKKAWQAQSPAVFPVKFITDTQAVRTDAASLLKHCDLFDDCWEMLSPGVEIPVVCGVTEQTVRRAIGTWYDVELGELSQQEAKDLMVFADYVRCESLGTEVLLSTLWHRGFPMRQLWQAAAALPTTGHVCSRMINILLGYCESPECFIEDVRLDEDPHHDFQAAVHLPPHDAIRHWTGTGDLQAVTALLKHVNPAHPVIARIQRVSASVQQEHTEGEEDVGRARQL